MLHLYNTLTRSKNEVHKTEKSLEIFVCGPTTYDRQHIGNFRTFLFFDLLVRYLRSLGQKVSYLQNITDIDDKIIVRAQQENKKWQEVTKQYEEAFLGTLKDFNITSTDAHRKATEHIPEIIDQIKRLVALGHVYKIEADGWYFDLSTFQGYGKLSGRTIEQAEDGVSRIDQSEKKRNKGDFAVWKFSKPGEPVWESAELGDGRPGWHVEDTAIAEKYFGLQYDLHGGGGDLMFPHHEAEIAIAESLSGKEPFVKHWLHTGMLTVDGQKMSKSKGNFMTGEDFLAKHPGEVLRMMSLLTHYRSRLDYSTAAVHQAQQNLKTVRDTLERLNFLLEKKHHNKDPHNLSVKEYELRFQEALQDDFNTPKAFSVLFELLNKANDHLYNLNQQSAENLKEFLIGIFTTLGFENLILGVPAEVAALLEKRELFRADKQFTQADALRSEIEALGYVVEDTPLGALALLK